MVAQTQMLDTVIARLSQRLQGMSEDEKSALWIVATGRHEQFEIVQGSSVDRVLTDYARWVPGLRQSDQRLGHGLTSWRFDQGARRRFQAALEACLVGEAKQSLSQSWNLEVVKIALAVAALYALLRMVVVPVLDLASAFLLGAWGLAPLAGGFLHLLVVFTAVVLGLSLLIGGETAYKSLARLSLLKADQPFLALATGGSFVALDLALQRVLVWLEVLPVEVLAMPDLSFVLAHGLRALLVLATAFLAIRVALHIKARELGV